MKIIALIPVKNESWILPLFLSSLKNFADEIVVLDDNSTDSSRDIVREHGGIVFKNEEAVKSGWAEHSMREKLLEIGRGRGGTHFICLDADEIFSSNLTHNFRALLASMKPGEKLSFKWVTLWKSPQQYRNDGFYKTLWKDFIFCDDGMSRYPYAFLGVSRTPGDSKKTIKVPEKSGVVLHFQYVPWLRTQYKQAWYKCSELIKGERSAKRINNIYSHTMRETSETSPIPNEWMAGINIPQSIEKTMPDWHPKKILEWFDKYGIKFFEPLQIWHIDALKKEFIKRVGREPVPQTFHPLLVIANMVKNKIKNIFQ